MLNNSVCVYRLMSCVILQYRVDISINLNNLGSRSKILGLKYTQICLFYSFNTSKYSFSCIFGCILFTNVMYFLAIFFSKQCLFCVLVHCSVRERHIHVFIDLSTGFLSSINWNDIAKFCEDWHIIRTLTLQNDYFQHFRIINRK